MNVVWDRGVVYEVERGCVGVLVLGWEGQYVKRTGKQLLLGLKLTKYELFYHIILAFTLHSFVNP